MDPCLHKPTLTEGDLVLRPFRREDGGRMLEILKIPEVLFLTGSVESREEAENPTFDAKEIICQSEKSYSAYWNLMIEHDMSMKK